MLVLTTSKTGLVIYVCLNNSCFVLRHFKIMSHVSNRPIVLVWQGSILSKISGNPSGLPR